MSEDSITKNSWVGLKISTLGVGCALLVAGTWKTNEFFNRWKDGDRVAHEEIVAVMQANQSAIEQNQIVLARLVEESVSRADHNSWSRLLEALNEDLRVPEID